MGRGSKNAAPMPDSPRECQHCTFQNAVHSVDCEMCGLPFEFNRLKTCWVAVNLTTSPKPDSPNGAGQISDLYGERISLLSKGDLIKQIAKIYSTWSTDGRSKEVAFRKKRLPERRRSSLASMLTALIVREELTIVDGQKS